MTEGIKMLNIGVELSGVMLCLLGVILALDTKADRRTRRWFVRFYAGMLVLLCANLAGLGMRGRPGPGWRAGLYLANYVEFLMPCLLCCLLTNYLIFLLCPEEGGRGLRVFCWALAGLHTALLTLSQFTGLYYTLDAGNVYRRSPGYPLAYLETGVLMLLNLFLLLRRGGELSARERGAFWSFLIIPGVAIVLQNFQYGVNFTIFSILIGGFVMYLSILEEQTERFYRQRAEVAQMKAELLLSRVQPHFLYNALGAIGQLCRDNPAAKQAIDQFTRFLRGNLYEINQSAPVPFGTELEYTRAYLSLEQLRFGERLRVVYDLETEEFMLPTLTLQPLVENAVQHGVQQNPSGVGSVVIATRQFTGYWEVRVTDDGPGFAPDALPDDAREGIGLEIVRERLRSISGGELQVESAPGRGCTAVILLPKEASDADFCA